MVERILIVRLSAIGDVVHTLPCLHALRRAYPKARIGWLVEELSAALLQGHPELDALYIIPKKRWRKQPLTSWLSGEKTRFYKEVRKEKWEVAIDFQGLTKSGLNLWFSGASRRIGFAGENSRELNRCFCNTRVAPDGSAIHVIEKNLALLKPLGIETKPEQVGWRFPEFQDEREKLAPFLEETGNFVALYPGTGWESKRWPAKQFARFCQLWKESQGQGGSSLVLVWGPGEEGICREIMEKACLPEEDLLMAPPTNLRELAVLLEKARLVIGGDTGPIHLAAGLNRPVLGLYGGTDPYRNGPWGWQDKVIWQEDISCVPCWKTRCHSPRFLECLEALEPAKVVDRAQVLLESSPGK